MWPQTELPLTNCDRCGSRLAGRIDRALNFSADSIPRISALCSLSGSGAVIRHLFRCATRLIYDTSVSAHIAHLARRLWSSIPAPCRWNVCAEVGPSCREGLHHPVATASECGLPPSESLRSAPSHRFDLRRKSFPAERTYLKSPERSLMQINRDC